MKTFLLLFLIPFTSAYSQTHLMDSLQNVIRKNGEDTNAVIAYRALAGLSINTDLEKGILYAKKGVELGKKLGFDKGVAGCYLNMSSLFSSLGKQDSAFIYNDLAIQYAKKVGEPGRVGLVYLNRADLMMKVERFKEALIFCDSGRVYAEKAGREDLIARAYANVGNIYYLQNNYRDSQGYYEKAFPLFQKTGHLRMLGIIKNNIGNVHKHLGQYELAVKDFKEALKHAEDAQDKISLPMYYSNLSDVYAEMKNWKEAEKNGDISLKYARSTNNNHQIAFSQLLLSKVYLNTHRYEQSLKAATEALAISEADGNLDQQESATELLSDTFHKMGRIEDAYVFALKNKTLNDSLNKSRFEADVAKLQTEYETQQKESQILLLEKENQLHQQKLKKNQLIIIGSVLLSLMALASIGLLISRNKARQRTRELEIRTTLASDLHDEVGSSLSSIFLLSQVIKNQQNQDRKEELFETLTRNVKETVDQVRDMVWMVKPDEESQLAQRMERFAYDICNGLEMELDLKLEEVQDLNMEQRRNIYLIFKEAVNNAVKYSGGTLLQVLLKQSGHSIILQVSDNGKGFDPNSPKNGNGLRNMRRRAEELQAKLDIHSSPDQGTMIHLEYHPN
jgi:two-component system sensor histidine kinase UhpB